MSEGISRKNKQKTNFLCVTNCPEVVFCYIIQFVRTMHEQTFVYPRRAFAFAFLMIHKLRKYDLFKILFIIVRSLHGVAKFRDNSCQQHRVC